MADYISRQYLLDEYDRQHQGPPGGARKIIAEAPAADVAPVVHAHWIRYDDADIVEGYYVPEYECSKCRAWKKDDSDYCPDCGARMDEEG